MEGPRNVIADTFSRLSRNDVSSPLVGEKAANAVNDSESNNYESSHSLLIDDKDTMNCLMDLICLSSRKQKDERPTKQRKCFEKISNDRNKSAL